MRNGMAPGRSRPELTSGPGDVMNGWPGPVDSPDGNIIMSTGGGGGSNVSVWQTVVTLLTGGGIAAVAAVGLKVLEYFRKNKLTDEDRKQVAQREARDEAKSEFDQM